MDVNNSKTSAKSGEKVTSNDKKQTIPIDNELEMHNQTNVDMSSEPTLSNQNASNKSATDASSNIRHFICKKYPKHLSAKFREMMRAQSFVDVTLICQRKKIHAHQFLLAACSPYFRQIFRDNRSKHSVVVFKDVIYEDLKAAITFMYEGEVKIPLNRCDSFWELVNVFSISVESENKSTAKESLESSTSVTNKIEDLKLTDTEPDKGLPDVKSEAKNEIPGAKDTEKSASQASGSRSAVDESNDAIATSSKDIPGTSSGAIKKIRKQQPTISSDDLDEEDDFTVDEDQEIDDDDEEEYSSDDEDEDIDEGEEEEEEEEEDRNSNSEFLIDMKNASFENVCEIAENESKKIKQTKCPSSSPSECDRFFSILVQALSNLTALNVTETSLIIFNLEIYTYERTITTIDMIYQILLNKPDAHKSAAYFAKLCHHLAAPNDKFRTKLIDKCENLFANEILRKQLLPKLDGNANVNSLDQQMCEIQELEIYLSNERCKTIVLFVAGLYIERTLTIQKLVNFFDALAGQQSYSKLEYLCDLLNGVGKCLECDNDRISDLMHSNLSKYFSVLKSIVDNKKNKIDETFRTKIEDLIKMRSLKWNPSGNAVLSSVFPQSEALPNGLVNAAPSCLSKFDTLQNDLFWIRNNKTSSNIDTSFIPQLNLKVAKTVAAPAFKTRPKPLTLNDFFRQVQTEKAEFKQDVKRNAPIKSNEPLYTTKRLENNLIPPRGDFQLDELNGQAGRRAPWTPFVIKSLNLQSRQARRKAKKINNRK